LLDPAGKDSAASEAHGTPWRLLALLIAMAGVSSLSLNILVPAIPGLAAKFAADPASVQLAVSLYLMGLAASQLVFGPLSDRFGRRPSPAPRPSSPPASQASSARASPNRSAPRPDRPSAARSSATSMIANTQPP
jgi:Major Facilitator Superfamily